MFSVLAVAAIFAGTAVLTVPSQSVAEAPMKKKSVKKKKAKSAGQKKAEARMRARAAKAKRKKRAAAAAKKKRAAQAKAAKTKKRVSKRKSKRVKTKRRMDKAKSSKKEMAKSKPDTSGGKPTQTALSVQPSSKLIRLVRSIETEMKAGEADGSLTKGEIARLASLKQRVEIMDRMSKNDETFSAWELRYLETANTILQKIIQRRRLDGVMSVEPRHVEMRIQRGLHDNTLTEQQAENLREIQRRILVDRNEADQDGSLSPKEKARYMRAQYKLSDLLNHTRRYGPIARTLGQNRFKETLERGVRNGAFTRTEAKSLWRTHQRIVSLREKAISDGRITSTELTVLNNRLKAARHRLSFGEREAYRRSLRVRRGRVAARASGGGGVRAGGGSDHGMGNAMRSYGRSVGKGMRSLGRAFGR
jgi:hypothetical protein